MSICESGNCTSDTTWQLSTQMATTLAFSRRSANTYYARQNGTLLWITNMTEPIREIISVDDLFHVFNRFFSVGPTESTTQDLIRWIVTYLQGYLDEPSTQEIKVTIDFLQSLLVTPLLWFHANDFNSNFTVPSETSPTLNLPSNLYVTGNLATRNSRILIAKWTVIVFTALGVSLYVWCVAVLCWSSTRYLPNISLFPLLDFGWRMARGDGSFHDLLINVVGANSSDYRKNLQNVKVHLRSVKRNGSQVDGLFMTE